MSLDLMEMYDLKDEVDEGGILEVVGGELVENER